MEYSKFNDPMNYMRVTRELIDMGIPGTAIFAAKSDESINHVKASYCLTSIDELDKLLDDIDLVIIENIALSKYLNSDIRICNTQRLQHNTGKFKEKNK